MKKWYRLLHPKVICLVTSLNKKGQINAAPFAWATPLCDDPPILMIAPWYESHTFKNISETKEFVINIVPKELKEKIKICSEDFPEGVNELEKAGLTWSNSKTVKSPRVNECLAWIECRTKEILKKEDEYSIIIADVLCVETKGKYYENFLPKKEVLLHLGGDNYSSIRI